MAVNSSISLDMGANNSQTRLKPEQRFKLVTIGDGGTGKTSLLIRYLRGEFSDAYVPTVFENYTKSIKKDGKMIELALWDTAGQEEYDRLRALSYPETDVCLVCYSVDNPISLENAFDKWIPEIQTYCPGVPFILVGCKADSTNRVITTEFGLQLAAEKGAHAFVECSSKQGNSIEEPFTQAVKAALRPGDRLIVKQLAQANSHAKKPKRKVSYPNYGRLAAKQQQQQQSQGQSGQPMQRTHAVKSTQANGSSSKQRDSRQPPEATPSKCCLIL